MAVAVAVAVAVGVGTGVFVAVAVGVTVGVFVTVGVGVIVGVFVGVGVGVDSGDCTQMLANGSVGQPFLLHAGPVVPPTVLETSLCGTPFNTGVRSNGGATLTLTTYAFAPLTVSYQAPCTIQTSSSSEQTTSTLSGRTPPVIVTPLQVSALESKVLD